MKTKYIIALLLLICSITATARTDDYKRLADIEGVTYVRISKLLLSIISDDEGLFSKIKNIHIFTADEPDGIYKLKKGSTFINEENNYEELLRAKEEDTLTVIYMRKLKKGLNEYVICADCDSDNYSLIVIKGKLTLEDIKNLQNSSVININ